MLACCCVASGPGKAEQKQRESEANKAAATLWLGDIGEEAGSWKQITNELKVVRFCVLAPRLFG